MPFFSGPRIGKPPVAPSPPPSGGGGDDDDWLERSAGAIIASRLDVTDTYTATGVTTDPGAATITLWLNDANLVEHDTAIKPPSSGSGSGAAAVASTRFLHLNTTDTNEGALKMFSGPANKTGEGDTVWFSVRWRFPREMAWQRWPTATDSRTGTKFFIFGSYQLANEQNTIVASDTDGLNTPGFYFYPGPTNPENDGSFTSSIGPDFRKQFELDRNVANPAGDIVYPLTNPNPDTGSNFSTWQAERARWGHMYTAYSNPGSAETRFGYGDPFSGSVRIIPDEWFTQTFRIQVGTWGAADTRICMWFAHENQPYIKLYDDDQVTLGSDQDLNTFWITTYVTNRIPGGRKIASRTNNITGVSLAVCGLATPVGDGVLSWNASTQRLTWHGLGEADGTPVGFSTTNNIRVRNVCAGAAQTWQASTNYALHAVVRPTTPNGRHYFASVDAGSSAGTQPTWPTGFGSTVVDGGITWKCINNVESFVVAELTGTLPGTDQTDTITIADGRTDTFCNAADAIMKRSAINAPGGYPPLGADPVWYESATVSEWKALTAGPAPALVDVDPCPLENCLYSATEGQNGVTDDWCGATASPESLLICAQGGHDGYYGNEAYEYMFGEDPPRWYRRTEPSTSIQQAPYYNDGKPAARHGYSHDCFIPAGTTNGNRHFAAMTVAHSIGSGNSSAKAFSYQRAGMVYDPEDFWPNYPGQRQAQATVAYDPVTHKVWSQEGPINQADWTLWSMDVATKTWSQHGNASGLNDFTVISRTLDPVRRVLVMHRDDKLWIRDIEHPNDPGRAYTVSGLSAGAGPGFCYEPVSGKWVSWNGGKTLVVITPPSNYRTGDGSISNGLNASATYAISATITPAGGATPTSGNTNGTWGRFQYIARPHGICVVNRNTESMYFFKLPAAGI